MRLHLQWYVLHLYSLNVRYSKSGFTFKVVHSLAPSVLTFTRAFRRLMLDRAHSEQKQRAVHCLTGCIYYSFILGLGVSATPLSKVAHPWSEDCRASALGPKDGVAAPSVG